MGRLITIILSVTIMSISGCAGQTQQEKGTKTGALIGAGVGAVLGQVIGKDSESTAIGAAAGTILGGVVGNRVGAYMDRQEQELRATSEAEIERSEQAIIATFKSDLFFDVDSAILKPGCAAEMDRVAGVLTKYPETNIRVEGHTDSSGAEAYNQQLSERRATAVKNALIQRNVVPDRIQTLGFGESNPISNDQAQNRRVSLIITPKSQG